MDHVRFNALSRDGRLDISKRVSSVVKKDRVALKKQIATLQIASSTFDMVQELKNFNKFSGKIFSHLQKRISSLNFPMRIAIGSTIAVMLTVNIPLILTGASILLDIMGTISIIYVFSKGISSIFSNFMSAKDIKDHKYLIRGVKLMLTGLVIASIAHFGIVAAIPLVSSAVIIHKLPIKLGSSGFTGISKFFKQCNSIDGGLELFYEEIKSMFM